ncbi:MAG: NUDIX hydrolase [Salinivirgaceae bacterium]|nr:NUDIX hydrolase [Salinivirgaceae bacterium]
MIYQNHPKQLISVDCVVFGYQNEQLKLLLFERDLEPAKGELSLVGGWVNENKSVEDAAAQVLLHLTGLSDIFLKQVSVFSKPDRDPGGRVISVVFYALINIEDHNQKLVDEFGAKWWPVDQLPNLVFDHNLMVEKALEKLQQLATYELVGRDLLAEQFTITQLRNLYNSIFQREFDPGNFRKKILSLKAMDRLDIKDTSESKKGAFYYQFKSQEEINISERIVKL